MPNYRYQSSEAMCRARNACRDSCMEDRMSGRSRNEKDQNDKSLAMAYVPWQKWQSLYEAEKGFCRGTIFAELDKPFEGTGGRLR